MNHESLRGFVYHVGNQPQFLRESIRIILETAVMPSSASNYWPAKILMIAAGMCLVYNWDEEFQKVRTVLSKNFIICNEHGSCLVFYLLILTSVLE